MIKAHKKAPAPGIQDYPEPVLFLMAVNLVPDNRCIPLHHHRKMSVGLAH